MSSLIPSVDGRNEIWQEKWGKTKNRPSVGPVWVNKKSKYASRCQKHVRQVHTAWSYEVANFQSFPSPSTHTHTSANLFPVVQTHICPNMGRLVPLGVASGLIIPLLVSLSEGHHGSRWCLLVFSSLSLLMWMISPAQSKHRVIVQCCNGKNRHMCSIFPA